MDELHDVDDQVGRRLVVGDDRFYGFRPRRPTGARARRWVSKRSTTRGTACLVAFDVARPPVLETEALLDRARRARRR